MGTIDFVPTTRRLSREAGATVVEYALLVALIAMVCFSAVVYFGNQSSGSLERTGQSVTNAG